MEQRRVKKPVIFVSDYLLEFLFCIEFSRRKNKVPIEKVVH